MSVAISRKFAMVNSVAFCGKTSTKSVWRYLWKIAANIVCGRVAETHLQLATIFNYPQADSQQIFFVAIYSYQ